MLLWQLSRLKTPFERQANEHRNVVWTLEADHGETLTTESLFETLLWDTHGLNLRVGIGSRNEKEQSEHRPV